MSRFVLGETKRHIPFVVSIGNKNESDNIRTIKNALFEGADGFLIHTEHLPEEYRTDESLKKTFEATENRPILVLAYRGPRKAETDDDRAEFLLRSLDLGADSIDVMSDFYAPGSQNQYTKDPEAIKKQEDLIAKVHAKGKTVMMSTHTDRMLTLAETIEIALEHQRRGADIVKIVLKPDRYGLVPEGLNICGEVSKALDVPFLFIMNTVYGRSTRLIAPLFGSCMVLCAQDYHYCTNTDKPLLRAARDIYNNMDLDIYKAIEYNKKGIL
ncbi:MAG: type I 3-dehydroquinate dehydratase [Clostridia bacterium]|nr:type I 3-dehydroquinate dehydratase [Clostridia bacterium]